MYLRCPCTPLGGYMFHFLRYDFGSWGGFLEVLGASLCWKVVLEFWFGHPKCHFWYPQNGCFCHFFYFAYFWVIFPLARTIFFKCKFRSQGALKSKSWRKQTSFKIKFPIQFQRGGSLSQLLIFHRALTPNAMSMSSQTRQPISRGVCQSVTRRAFGTTRMPLLLTTDILADVVFSSLIHLKELTSSLKVLKVYQEGLDNS